MSRRRNERSWNRERSVDPGSLKLASAKKGCRREKGLPCPPRRCTRKRSCNRKLLAKRRTSAIHTLLLLALAVQLPRFPLKVDSKPAVAPGRRRVVVLG